MAQILGYLFYNLTISLIALILGVFQLTHLSSNCFSFPVLALLHGTGCSHVCASAQATLQHSCLKWKHFQIFTIQYDVGCLFQRDIIFISL